MAMMKRKNKRKKKVHKRKSHYFQLSESKKKLKPTSKRSQEDNGCLSTAVPFRASFIYTLCSRSSASPLLPQGIPAFPDVQLFMWSSDKSSWAAHLQSEQRGSPFSGHAALDNLISLTTGSVYLLNASLFNHLKQHNTVCNSDHVVESGVFRLFFGKVCVYFGFLYEFLCVMFW